MKQLVIGLSLVLYSATVMASTPVAKILGSFTSVDARQGVAVDENYVYVINNTSISQHVKQTGKLVKQWQQAPQSNGKLTHMDSGMVWQGRLYASHSNYPGTPMTSSVEIWGTPALKHVANHSFGIQLGSFTWLDRYDGYWWGTFANYDKVQKGQTTAYGETRNTVMVKMDDEFRILQRWVFPQGLLERFSPMSNSGGSWGPDGLLYITGHDHPEAYALKLPELGSELLWVGTIPLPEQIEGQGVAWDRSESERVMWGISKRLKTVFKVAMPPLEPQ